MGEKHESMTVDEYLKRSQEITVIGSLEANGGQIAGKTDTGPQQCRCLL